VVERLAGRRPDLIVALETLGRDAQEPLEHFLMGHLDEAELLKQTSAWPDYRSADAALLQFAAARNLPVVAANIPRALSEQVARQGRSTLEAAASQGSFAPEPGCPPDDPDLRQAGAGRTGLAEKGALAECVSAETIAQSIAEAYVQRQAGRERPILVSVNEPSRTGFGPGVVSRTRRRLPAALVVTVSIETVTNPEGVVPDASARSRAEYIIYTRR
jgi:hypothetical protein